MIDVWAFIFILLNAIYLYLTCSKYTSVFAEFKQSMRLRFLLWSLPLMPVIFMAIRLYHEYASLFTLVIVIPFIIACLAHAQYHFFDVQGLTRLNGIKKWLFGVEILAILTIIYFIIHLIFIIAQIAFFK